jgi:hypothetical protein
VLPLKGDTQKVCRAVGFTLLVLLAAGRAFGRDPSAQFEVVRVVTIQSDLAPQRDSYEGPNWLFWVKSARGEHAWVYAQSEGDLPTGGCAEVRPGKTRYRVSLLVAVDEARCADISLDPSLPEDRPFGDANLPRMVFE